MSFRTWMFVAALGLSFAPSIGASQEDVESAENAPDSTTSQDAEQGALNPIPALEGIEAAIRDLIREESEEERQSIADQAAKDLEAQTEMAKWAFEMALAAIASAIFTLGGLILIWRTMKVGDRTLSTTQKMAKDTRSIGTKQVRAYLTVTGATIEANGLSCMAYVYIENIGQSPTRGVNTAMKLSVNEIAQDLSHIRGKTGTCETQAADVAPGGTAIGCGVFFHSGNEEFWVAAKTTNSRISIDCTITWTDVFGDTQDAIFRLSHDPKYGAENVNGGVSETLCMRLSPCEFDGSFVEPFWV